MLRVSDRALPDPPAAEAVRAAGHRALRPGAAAARRRAVDQDRAHHLRTDRQEGQGHGGVGRAGSLVPGCVVPLCGQFILFVFLK